MSVAFQIFTLPSQQVLDTAANVLSGATLSFFLTGTNTPTNAYSDAARTLGFTALTADNAGMFIPVFLDPAVVYRVILKTAGGVTLQTWDPANESVLTAASFNTLYFLTDTHKQTAAEISAGVTPTNYAYAPGHVYRYGTNTTPGMTDMTAALQATINQATSGVVGAADAIWPADTYLVSGLAISGSGYNIRTGGGRSTLLKQTTGTSATTGQILKFTGGSVISGINIGDLAFIGNIATDTGEVHHSVYVFDDAATATITDIHFGDLFGTDIRGDVLYSGCVPARPSRNITAGRVSGTNIFRNLVSHTGGQLHVREVINAGPVGHDDIDIEPNIGNEACDFRADYVQIGCMTCTSQDSSLANVAQLLTLDCDLNRVAATTPAYTSPPGVNAIGLNIAYTKFFKATYAKFRNYNAIPIIGGTASFKSNLYFDVADFSNCCITEAVFNSLIADEGSGGIAYVEIGLLLATLFSTSKMCFNGNGMVVRVRRGVVSGGLLAAAIPNGHYENLTIDMNSAAGTLLSGCNDTKLNDVTVLNAGSATGMVNCVRNTWQNVKATFGTFVGSGCQQNRLINSTINGVLYSFDYADGYFLTKAMADANQTLSAIESDAVSIRCGGALTAQRNLVVNAVPRLYSVDNSTTGGFGVQAIGPSGTGIVIASGKKAMVLFDGTNVVRITPDT